MADNPRKLNIEVTTRCNLNCVICMRNVWKEDSGDMSLETFKALLPVFPELETVNIIGIGEPLLNEHIIVMIQLGKENLPPTGRFSLTTNATLIDDDMAKQLVSSGIDDIVVSIDGVTSETFDEIRKDATLNDILRNIGRLNWAKAECGSQLPRIGFEFVAMKSNVAELPQLVDLAFEHGVSFIIVTNLLPHSPEMNEQILYEINSGQAIELFNEAKAEAERRKLDMAFESLDVENYANALFGVPPLKDKLRSTKPVRDKVVGYDDTMERRFQLLDEIVSNARSQNVLMNLKNLMQRDGTNIARTAEIFAEASAKAKKHNIDLDLPTLIPNTQRECGFIRDGIAFVSWDGYVRPCNNLYHSYICYVNNREKSITSVTFGNVLQRDFREIWNSRDYRSFRRQVEKFDFAPCGDCPHAEACFALLAPVFRKDCYEYTLPCGDCPWARGILKCM
jgi:putative metalloenzyme radical SAM/SPASM domain maturase